MRPRKYVVGAVFVFKKLIIIIDALSCSNMLEGGAPELSNARNCSLVRRILSVLVFSFFLPLFYSGHS